MSRPGLSRLGIALLCAAATWVGCMEIEEPIDEPLSVTNGAQASGVQTVETRGSLTGEAASQTWWYPADDYALISGMLDGTVGDRDVLSAAEIVPWVGVGRDVYSVKSTTEEGVVMSIIDFSGPISDLLEAGMNGHVDTSRVYVQGCSGDSEDNFEYDEEADEVVVAVVATNDPAVLSLTVEARFYPTPSHSASVLTTTVMVAEQ